MQFAFTLEEILEIVGEGQTEGLTEVKVTGIASLDLAVVGDLSFLGNRKYRSEVAASRASVVLLPQDYKGEPSAGQVYVRVSNPSDSLARICERVEKDNWIKPDSGIHASAVVDPSAVIDPGACIGPLCVVEAGATIADGVVLESHVFIGCRAQLERDCWLKPQVTVASDCIIGKRVRLHSGVVIGSDGYGYSTVDGKHRKQPQIGRVVIENDVEIGSNSCVDRARFSETRISEGTKIDNLVQIAHNVVIGRHCLIVSQAGVSGSTTLEDRVIMGGQAGMVGHIRIGSGSRIGAQAGVNCDLAPASFVTDSPAYAHLQSRKTEILKRRLPELFKRVAKLEEMIDSKDQIQ